METKNVIQIFFLLCLLVFLTSSLVSSDSCDSCENACTIRCNETFENRQTPTAEYFNLTLDKSTDVRINVTPNSGFPLNDYTLHVLWEKDECVSLDHVSCNRTSPVGGPKYCIRMSHRLTRGTYSIMVLNNTYSPGTTYTINVSCGMWCGNGKNESWETCDWKLDPVANPNPNKPCQAYEYCNDACECEDLRPTTSGCSFFDYCNAENDPETNAPCEWGKNCYTADPDPEYQQRIFKICNATTSWHKNSLTFNCV